MRDETPSTTAMAVATGESLRGAMTLAEATLLLDGAGFRVLDEHGNREWATRFGEGAPAVEILERLFIAERAG